MPAPPAISSACLYSLPAHTCLAKPLVVEVVEEVEAVLISPTCIHSSPAQTCLAKQLAVEVVVEVVEEVVVLISSVYTHCLLTLALPLGVEVEVEVVVVISSTCLHSLPTHTSLANQLISLANILNSTGLLKSSSSSS